MTKTLDRLAREWYNIHQSSDTRLQLPLSQTGQVLVEVVFIIVFARKKTTDILYVRARDNNFLLMQINKEKDVFYIYYLPCLQIQF
jgi:hypothetical protein